MAPKCVRGPAVIWGCRTRRATAENAPAPGAESPFARLIRLEAFDPSGGRPRAGVCGNPGRRVGIATERHRRRISRRRFQPSRCHFPLRGPIEAVVLDDGAVLRATGQRDLRVSPDRFRNLRSRLAGLPWQRRRVAYDEPSALFDQRGCGRDPRVALAERAIVPSGSWRRGRRLHALRVSVCGRNFVLARRPV